MEQSSSRMERKKEETKQKILTVALALFREHGFETTTMEAIAEAVDIAKGTLYNYFPVKEAILDEYIRRAFRQQNEMRLAQMRRLPDTPARMSAVFVDLLQGIQAQPVIFAKYLAYRMQQWISFQLPEEEKSGFHLLAAEMIRLGRENGELRRDLPADTLEDLCEYTFMLVVKEFYLSPENFSVAQSIARCVDVFIYGAQARSKEV